MERYIMTRNINFIMDIISIHVTSYTIFKQKIGVPTFISWLLIFLPADHISVQILLLIAGQYLHDQIEPIKFSQKVKRMRQREVTHSSVPLVQGRAALCLQCGGALRPCDHISVVLLGGRKRVLVVLKLNNQISKITTPLNMIGDKRNLEIKSLIKLCSRRF